MVVDKVAHFGVGYIITDVSLSLGFSVPVSLGLGVLVGASKEVYDFYFGGNCEALDFAATSFGSVVSLFVNF